VLVLLEALGIALQQQRGITQLMHTAVVPFVALQPLPDLQHLPRLVDHPLGKVLLESVVAVIFVLGHGLDSVWGGGESGLGGGSMLPPANRYASTADPLASAFCLSPGAAPTVSLPAGAAHRPALHL